MKNARETKNTLDCSIDFLSIVLQIRASMSVLNRRKSTKALARQQLAQYINQENVDETDLLLPPEYTLDNIEQQLGSAKRSFWQPRECFLPVAALSPLHLMLT